MRGISFDAPGMGRSETPLIAPSCAGWRGERLLDRLELECADLVGYSFGGAMAQQFAIQSPERLRRLVVAASVPGWGGVPGRLTAMLTMGTPLRYYSRAFYEHTAGTVAGGRTRYDHVHVRRLWSDRAMHPPTVLGYAQQLWAMSTWSSLPWLSRIQSPTLVIVGDDDPLVPTRNALMMASRIPDARVFVGEGEGHFQLLDPESQAIRAIPEFLGAPALEQSEVWRVAREVDRADADMQIRTDGLGALPWGAVSAFVRQLVR